MCIVDEQAEPGAKPQTATLQHTRAVGTHLWMLQDWPGAALYAAAEARGGLHIVEQSLWHAVPAFMRKLSAALKKHTGKDLPLNATPFRFGSWMGGDRDGNPNVTAKVQQQHRS